MEIEREIEKVSPNYAKLIQQYAQESHNEAEFRSKITRLIEGFAEKVKLDLHLREEYTIINGRADAVYDRLIIEYEKPGSLRNNNDFRANKHAVEQLRLYIKGLIKKEGRKPERIAGVVLDGSYFVFMRIRKGVLHIDLPLDVSSYSVRFFLKLLTSLSTELALIPENLVAHFGENTDISRKAIAALYSTIIASDSPKVVTLFKQWKLQFSEASDYKQTINTQLENFTKNFGLENNDISPFHFFFSLHTYYAILIKLLAVQVVHYYLMPRLGASLKQAATYNKDRLKSYLKKMEEGGIFRSLGIINFLEGDFFSWYLDLWNEDIFQALTSMTTTLADYSLVSLDVDPDTTRDLLKKLYQQLMPKVLRHNLGEYYTPDWLAERILNMLEAGRYKGDPKKSILDPACGSGTFLVIVIKKIREYAWANAISEQEILENILSNVVGFDLNPLAVISARTNYLLALGDLLQHRKGDINIPIYLCDSILTPQEGEDLFGKGIMKFNTAVGVFSIPSNIIKANYIDILSNILEESVKLNLNKKQFIEKVCEKLPLNHKQDLKDIEIICKLYEKLLDLEKKGINGIWARIVKNAFAPLFAREFDYVVGNPPWINWEHLPEQYRIDTKPLWISYGLFPHVGVDTILGKGKKDISMILTYVAIDKYLKGNGKLGFLITQAVFKSSGAGQGFRRFQLGEKTYMRVLYVDDMVELKPFEGVGNRTSIVFIQKGRKTKYPVPYNYWVKKIKGKSIKDTLPLDEVSKIATYRRFVAEPVDASDDTSAWITGRPKALKAVRKMLKKSNYTAHEGCNTGGANAVFLVEIVDKKPDGLVIISNITEGAKRKVESIQAAIEPDLIYPFLRGNDVKKWKAYPSRKIIMVQDPETRRGIDVDEMKMKYPQTYIYLKRFEKDLRARAAFKRYFTKKDRNHNIVETGPFYSMFDVGHYSFAPYKVVWLGFGASEMKVAVCKAIDGKSIMTNQAMHPAISLTDPKEAHYICALMNSLPFNFAVVSHTEKGGKSFAQSNILKSIYIPDYNEKDDKHQSLISLSVQAHKAANSSSIEKIHEIEGQIDNIASQIWNLTKEELEDMKYSLDDMASP